jgi:hypothetical protein
MTAESGMAITVMLQLLLVLGVYTSSEQMATSNAVLEQDIA